MAGSPLDILNALNQQFGQLFPDVAKSAQQDLNQQAKAALNSLVSKLDVVTREEFEIQQQVLLKTREKLEAMEKRVAALEAQLTDTSSIANTASDTSDPGN